MRTQYLDFLKLKIKQDKLRSKKDYVTGKERIDFHLSFINFHPDTFSNRDSEEVLFTLDEEDIEYFTQKAKRKAGDQHIKRANELNREFKEIMSALEPESDKSS